MVRLVIDTDPGIDAAQAIMIALAHPEAQVEAITTVAGNVSVERTTANACTILDIVERDVPVYAGCARPLVATALPDASFAHGKDGLGDSGYPSSQRKVADEHAVQALTRLGNAFPGELRLVTIGPLTNLALATRLDPALPEKHERLVVMGGAIRGTGTFTPAAEFNIGADPEAAAVVFDAWPGLSLVPWETAMAYELAVEQLEALMAIDSGAPSSSSASRGGTSTSSTTSWGARSWSAATHWPLLWRWSQISCAGPRRATSRSSWQGTTHGARPWWTGSIEQGTRRMSTWYWNRTPSGSGS